MPIVTTRDSTSLFVCDWGDPALPPVVFVHAWGLNGDMWSAQVPGFVDAGFRPITYDQRGYGWSSRPRGGYDLDVLADDLAAVIDALDLRGVVLVGHSFGTQVAVRYLTRQGSRRIAGVVLSAPLPPMPRRSDDNPDGIDEAIFAASRHAMARDIGAFVEATSSSDYFGAKPISPTLADWTRRQIVDAPLHVLMETQKTMTRADLRADLAAVDRPTIILHGTADRSAPLEAAGKPTAALVPGSRLVVFDGAGHGLYTSEAADYNAEIIRFVSALPAAQVTGPHPG